MSFTAIIEDSNDNNFNRTKSTDSLPSMYNNDGQGLEPDINPDEQEEKARLISQVLELQNTLDGMRIEILEFQDKKLRRKKKLIFSLQF